MMTVATLLDAALKAAGIPIIGVSIGDPNTRGTWRVQYEAGATDAQRAAGAVLLTTLTIDAKTQAVQDQRDAQAQVDAIPLYLRAIVLTVFDQINVIRNSLPVPLPAIKPAEAIAAIKQKASGL